VSVLLRNLLHFAELLRALGLDVPAGRTLDVALALEHVEIGRRSDFYFTLQALLVHRHADLPMFDQAFLMFWRRPPTEWSPTDLRAMGERRRIGPPERERPSIGSHDGGAGSSIEQDTVQRVAPMSYGSREVLRNKDFAAFTEEEICEARAMMAALAWEPGRRRTRRWRSGGDEAADLRRVVRQAVRFGGEPLVIPARERRWQRRPLVLLCDVSGSMERYSRILLHFAHGLASRLGHIEVFLFATRLTRVTGAIHRRGVEEAVRSVLAKATDWGGGTRIGATLRTFNLEWARRVTGRGPVVLLISDGWDRGEPADLAREMAQLARRCHRLIWLNPLLGSPSYQPLARGMQAALPFVDDFLPVHNLVSLEALAAHLNALPSRRRPRRRAA
jgi:uncharacterized protein with von Willebrand factor type A (vWA) domain